MALASWLPGMVLVLKVVEELVAFVAGGDELAPLDGDDDDDDDDDEAVFESELDSVVVADDDVLELDSVFEELDRVVVGLDSVLVADTDTVPSRGQESARLRPAGALPPWHWVACHWCS